MCCSRCQSQCFKCINFLTDTVLVANTTLVVVDVVPPALTPCSEGLAVLSSRISPALHDPITCTYTVIVFVGSILEHAAEGFAKPSNAEYIFI